MPELYPKTWKFQSFFSWMSKPYFFASLNNLIIFPWWNISSQIFLSTWEISAHFSLGSLNSFCYVSLSRHLFLWSLFLLSSTVYFELSKIVWWFRIRRVFLFDLHQCEIGDRSVFPNNRILVHLQSSSSPKFLKNLLSSHMSTTPVRSDDPGFPFFLRV